MDPVTLSMLGGSLGGQLIGGYIQGESAKDAIRAEARAKEKLKRNLTGVYTEGFEDIQGMYSPLSDMLPGALTGLQQDYSVDPTQFQYDKTTQDFLDPSIDYQIEQAGRGIESSASARGGLLSGATLKALQESGQAIAQQGYGDAQSRMMQDKLFAFNEMNNQYQQQVNQGNQQYGQAQNLGNMAMQGLGATANARQNMASGIGSGISGVGTNPQTAGVTGSMMGSAISNFANPQNVMQMYDAYNTMSSNQGPLQSPVIPPTR